MCHPNKNFIFCTCQDGKPSSLADYTWTLTRFVGNKPSLLIGKIRAPKDDLKNGITISNILAQLNSDFKSFDFDYYPEDRDSLDISVTHQNGHYEYFKLLFQNGEWTKGRNPAFSSITKTIASGKIFNAKSNDS